MRKILVLIYQMKVKIKDLAISIQEFFQQEKFLLNQTIIKVIIVEIIIIITKKIKLIKNQIYPIKINLECI